MLYGEQFLKQTEPQVFYPQAILALIGVALAFVVGLGWLTDPNYLSLHAFYRARLVRAYLGASNAKRGTNAAEITEAVDGRRPASLDRGTDVGPDRRGPYQLVNTTLESGRRARPRDGAALGRGLRPVPELLRLPRAPGTGGPREYMTEPG